MPLSQLKNKENNRKSNNDENERKIEIEKRRAQRKNVEHLPHICCEVENFSSVRIRSFGRFLLCSSPL